MKKIIFQNLIFAFLLFTVFFTIEILLTQLFPLVKDYNIIEKAGINATRVSIMVTILMLVYQLFYFRANKISLKDFSISSFQKANFTIDKSIEDAKQIIESNKPKEKESFNLRYNKEQDIYKTKTKTSMMSWGEHIIIKLKKIDNFKTEVFVTSKPILKTAIIDFGKSAINVQRIKQMFLGYP